MSLSVSASARIPVCRTQSQNVYLKLSLSTEAAPGQTLALQCRSKSMHWSVSAC